MIHIVFSEAGIRHAECVKVSREEARRIDQYLYWPEEPCAKGHDEWRYTNDGKCVACVKMVRSRGRQREAEGLSPMTDVLRSQEEARDDRELANQLREVWDE